jgi:hypothetical protein
MEIRDPWEKLSKWAIKETTAHIKINKRPETAG